MQQPHGCLRFTSVDQSKKPCVLPEAALQRPAPASQAARCSGGPGPLELSARKSWIAASDGSARLVRARDRCRQAPRLNLLWYSRPSRGGGTLKLSLCFTLRYRAVMCGRQMCREGDAGCEAVPLRPWALGGVAFRWTERPGRCETNTTPAQTKGPATTSPARGWVHSLPTANPLMLCGYSAPLLRDHARQTSAGALIAPAMLPPCVTCHLGFGLPYAHNFVQRPPKWVGGDEMWCCGLVVRQWRVAFQSSKAERH